MCKQNIFVLSICLWLIAGSTWAQTHYVLDTGDPDERVCNPKSYTDLGNGIVRDNVTGLEWVQDGNLIASRNPEFDNDDTAGDGAVTWQHALDYIDLLNDDEYLGYDDWRLPSVEELSTLVDAGRYEPAIDTLFFPATEPFGYWSATTTASFTDSAWVVGFMAGGPANGTHKEKELYVRAVRGERCAALGAFVSNGDGTVTDMNTGLMWQQCNSGQLWDGVTCIGSDAGLNWGEAVDYVQELNDNGTYGYDDWRLPTSNELQSLIDYRIYDPATAFPNIRASDSVPYWYWYRYWSSTFFADAPHLRWFTEFYYGNTLLDDDTRRNGYARAVRGGPCWVDEAECLTDSDCDDGVFCNGTETCVSSICQSGEEPCADNTAMPLCDEVNDACAACLVDGDCPDDSLFCTGAPTCTNNMCGFAEDSCEGATPVCDNATDSCVECLNDTHCPPGYRCGSNVCFARGALQITKATVKAGKFRGADSIKFSGTMNATAADVNAAMNGTITLRIEAAGISDLDETTFTFPINATAFKKGKYKSPKVKPAVKTDPVEGLAFDTVKGKLSFTSQNLDLTGLACPITVKIQFGDYAAEVVLTEAVVNGTKPCPTL